MIVNAIEACAGRSAARIRLDLRIGFNVVLMLVVAMASAQTSGDHWFDRCVAATGNVRSLQAQLSVVGVGKMKGVFLRGTLELQKPNQGKIEIVDSESADPIRRYCDGRLLCYFVDKSHFVLEEAAADGDNLVRSCRCSEALYFFEPSELNVLRSSGKGFVLEGEQVIGGVHCKVLRLTGGAQNVTLRLYVGPDDLIHGTDVITHHDGSEFGFESRLTKVKINAAIGRDAFMYRATSKELPYVSGPPGPAIRELRRLGKFPQRGAILGDFRLKDLDGNLVSLYSVVKVNKVTVLNFWGVHCPPCRAELPIFNSRLPDWRKRGIGMLAVDLYDPLNEVKDVWTNEALTFPVVVRGASIGNALGLPGIPTTFLLDSHGVVLDTIVGVDMDELESVLDKNVSK